MMNAHKVDDTAIVKLGFSMFERSGEIAFGECDGIRYEQVGGIRKFSQFCVSRSLRIARVNLKKMRLEAFA